MRYVLDRLYLCAGGLAAFNILLICTIVTLQVCLNILARVGGVEWSYTLPSYADFAGYCLASASFLALAHTLKSGVHIRVNLMVQTMGHRVKWVMEMLTLAIGAATSGYAFWYGVRLTQESAHYGDTSTGIVAIPLWIPQSVMSLGLGVLTIAFVDLCLSSAMARHSILTDEGTE